MANRIGILEAEDIDVDKDLDVTYLPAATQEGNNTISPKKVKLSDIYNPIGSSPVEVMVFEHSGSTSEDFLSLVNTTPANAFTPTQSIHWDPSAILSPDNPFCSVSGQRDGFIFSVNGIYNVHMELNMTFAEGSITGAVRLKSAISESFTGNSEIREFGYIRANNAGAQIHKDSVDFELTTIITTSTPFVPVMSFRNIGTGTLNGGNQNTVGISRQGNEAITRMTFTKLANI